jgi:hypothetical protein
MTLCKRAQTSAWKALPVREFNVFAYSSVIENNAVSVAILVQYVTGILTLAIKRASLNGLSTPHCDRNVALVKAAADGSLDCTEAIIGE